MTADKRWSRRDMIQAGAAVGLTAMAAPAFATVKGDGAKRPNILFILADDLGYADLSCYGRRDYTTPRLDALAGEGVRLLQGYANSSVCSATRTGLVTGRYQDRFRVGLEEPLGDNPTIGLPPETRTMPGELRKLGYRTSLIGKWHLGTPPNFGPRKNGYDSFYGIPGGGTDYFRYDKIGGDATLYDGDTPVKSHRYLTDLLGDRAVSEIKASSGQSQPFFMSLHFTAPHWPWEGPADGNRAAALTDIFDRDGGSIAVYAEMVKSLDSNIGRVLDALKDSGQADDTIVIFTSDNGGDRFSDFWPFIGMKTELLEGGIRVPVIIRWPGHIAPGMDSEQVMISMDFMPTLLAAAGHADVASLGLDGINLLPLLTQGAARFDRKLFWRYKARDQAAHRDGRWKYLRLDGKEHLFDIETDQRERADLKDKEPQRFAAMKQAYAAWNDEMLPYPADSFSADGRGFVFDR